MEDVIAEHTATIIALTEDDTRDIVPITADIRKEAEAIKQQLELGDPD